MKNQKKHAHWALKNSSLAFVLLCLTMSFVVQAQHGKIVKSNDPFLKFNNFFRQSYAKTRQVIIERHAPAIAFVNGGLLFVGKGTKPRWENITPALYTDLKIISHIPLTLYVILALEKEGRLSTLKLEELKNFLAMVSNLRKNINKRSFVSNDQRKDQFSQTDLALNLANKCLRTNRFLHQDLKDFLKKSYPLVQRNILAATIAQLNIAHKYTKDFYITLSEEEKKQLLVVISGPKAARKQHSMTQYFARVLQVKGEGPKIVYAEGVFSRKGVMKTMGNFLLDIEIGESFFGDRWRMHRDLLGDAAQYHISTMLFGDFR